MHIKTLTLRHNNYGGIYIVNLLEKFIALTHTQMPQPTLFGYAHIFWLLIGLVAIIFVSLVCKKLTDKQLSKFLMIISSVLLVLEVIKQMNFSYNSTTDTWDYYWQQFPFQFCAIPMYAAFVASFLKESKFRSALYSFLATFGLFAGLAVSIYPVPVLSGVIFRFSQSMFHHLAMVVIGVVIFVSGRVEFNYKTFIKAIPIFVTCAILAFSMNILFHLTGNADSFNMFYVGPYFKSDIPILSSIGDLLHIESSNLHIGNFVFLLIYVLGFSLIAYIVLLVAILIRKISTKYKGL